MDLKDFKTPFNIVSLILAIIGISTGVYFYHLSKQYKSINYQVDQTASKIYDSKNTTSLIRLFEKDSTPIRENVYYIRGKIWNNGNLPVLTNDIRRPLTISLSSCKRILDYKIEKQYEDSSQEFALTKINDKTLKLNWKYFDPNNGFSFQVIYVGSENPQCKLNGKILGVSNFQEINSKTGISDWNFYFVLAICFIFGWFADIIFPKVLEKKSSLGINWRTFIVVAISIIISYVIFAILNKLNQPLIPF